MPASNEYRLTFTRVAGYAETERGSQSPRMSSVTALQAATKPIVRGASNHLEDRVQLGEQLPAVALRAQRGAIDDQGFQANTVLPMSGGRHRRSGAVEVPLVGQRGAAPGTLEIAVLDDRDALAGWASTKDELVGERRGR
jgi:hypothetical protein